MKFYMVDEVDDLVRDAPRFLMVAHNGSPVSRRVRLL